MVLLSAGLIFRLLQIFYVIVAANCNGYSEFWATKYAYGFSTIGAFLAIFWLCVVWALIDFLLVLKRRQYNNFYAVVITLSLLVASAGAALGTEKMYVMTSDIETSLARNKKNVYIATSCGDLMPDVLYRKH